jgi:hypothetical protein
MEHISSWSLLMVLICQVQNINNKKKKITEALLEASREVGL